MKTKSHPFIHFHHFSLRHNFGIVEGYIFESFLLCNLSSFFKLHLHLPTPNILSSIANSSITLTASKPRFSVIHIAPNILLPSRLFCFQLCIVTYLQQPKYSFHHLVSPTTQIPSQLAIKMPCSWVSLMSSLLREQVRET